VGAGEVTGGSEGSDPPFEPPPPHPCNRTLQKQAPSAKRARREAFVDIIIHPLPSQTRCRNLHRASPCFPRNEKQSGSIWLTSGFD
jgi:hypothetical protein